MKWSFLEMEVFRSCRWRWWENHSYKDRNALLSQSRRLEGPRQRDSKCSWPKTSQQRSLKRKMWSWWENQTRPEESFGQPFAKVASVRLLAFSWS